MRLSRLEFILWMGLVFVGVVTSVTIVGAILVPEFAPYAGPILGALIGPFMGVISGLVSALIGRSTIKQGIREEVENGGSK